MKKIFTILTVLMMFSCKNEAQNILAQWTFPTGTATDANPNVSTAENATKTLIAVGTSAIDFSKNGYTNKAAQATGWDNGMDTKYWQIEINTLGFNTITLSSRQQSGSTNPGPKDFKLQYKIGESGIWTDVVGGTITAANDWTTSAVNNLALPTECDNQSSVFIRWILTSNTNVSGGTIATNGATKIDEIYVNGLPANAINEQAANDYKKRISTIVENGMLILPNGLNVNSLVLFDLSGKVQMNINNPSNNIEMFQNKGMFILKLNTEIGEITKKIILQKIINIVCI